MVRAPEGPSAEAISLGNDHFYTPAHYEGKWVGIHEWHKDNNGEWCVGYVPFVDTALASGDAWDVQSLDPLTISPSLLCRHCSSHGFIREGRWVEA